MAHWTEGNTNYLIGRVDPKDQPSNSNSNNNNKPAYRCIMYSEVTSSSGKSSPVMYHQQKSSGHDQFRHARHKNPDLVELSASDSGFARDNIEIFEKSVLQILVSPDEFCRSIDAIMDEQFSFTFNKGKDLF